VTNGTMKDENESRKWRFLPNVSKRFRPKRMLNFFIDQPPGKNTEKCVDGFSNNNLDILSENNLVKNGCETSISNSVDENRINHLSSSSSSQEHPNKLSECYSSENIVKMSYKKSTTLSYSSEVNLLETLSTQNFIEMSSVDAKSTKLLKRHRPMSSLASIHLFVFCFLLLLKGCQVNAKAKTDLKGRSDNDTDIEEEGIASEKVKSLSLKYKNPNLIYLKTNSSCSQT
jgi:hypothetical protein